MKKEYDNLVSKPLQKVSQSNAYDIFDCQFGIKIQNCSDG